jgi:hypothetical protein
MLLSILYFPVHWRMVSWETVTPRRRAEHVTARLTFETERSSYVGTAPEGAKVPTCNS